LEESGRVKPSNPEWQKLKAEIESNNDSVIKLK
jgi:hypothetical protein